MDKKKKIVWPSRSKVKELHHWTEKIREALDVKSWLITDLSYMSDFEPLFKEEDINKAITNLSQKLGVPIKANDYVVDVAERLKNIN